jgi:hypothetical protein
MVSIKARFFGRQPLIQDLVQGVLAPFQPLDFSLVGPKMIGKSRLLKHLASLEGPLRGPDELGWRPERFRDGQNVIVGHYDCDWPAAQAHLTEFICQRLKVQLQEEEQLQLDWSQLKTAASPGQQIGQMVRQLGQQQIRVILLLDNFDRVLQSDRMTPDMVNELRPLTHELGLVVSTEYPLHDLNKTLAASPLFNVMHQHFVGLLEPAAAKAWIEAYEERFSLSEPVKQELLELAGSHPFLLARVNDLLMEMQPLLAEDEIIGVARLPLIRLRLAEHGRSLFEMNWRKLNEPQGQAALSLVEQLVQAAVPIGHVPAERTGALNWLINQALVTYKENHYTLFSPLLRKFLIEQMDLESPVPLTVPIAPTDIFESLTPIEAELLRYFQARSGVVISIEELLAEVWNQPEASPRRVQEAIRRLRNSLSRQSRAIGAIENERGLGYRFIPTSSFSGTQRTP